MQKLGHIITTPKNSGNTTKAQKLKRSKDQKITKAFVRQKVTRKQQAMCDLVIEDYQDLIDPQYKNWVCKCYYEIGDDKFRRLASEARSEAKKSARSLFGWSLKQEMIKKTLDKGFTRE